jgi:ATP-dependent DNA helicase RecG
MSLHTPIKNISRISPKYAKVLEKLGVKTVLDFLLYLPFRYDDFSKTVLPSRENIGEVITTQGKIIKLKNVRIFRRRMTVTEIIVQDENDTLLKAVWFNQSFIAETLKEGMEVRLSGKLGKEKDIFTMSNPAWERSGRDMTNTGRLVPIYRETSGITSKWIRWQIKPLLLLAREMDDIIPLEIRVKYNLYDIATTVTQLHFPDSKEKFIRAQKRMAFQEVFIVQLKALQIRQVWKNKKSANIKFSEKLIREFVSRLPFKLTNAQRKASFEILRDLEKSRPMNRLLNGDVGSGKTMVAAIASLQAATSGYQVAIMAPTEVLAKQHYESFLTIFENYDLQIGLLTNSYHYKQRTATKKSNLLNDIDFGEINILIGTHAIIQKDVHFKNLALVIIDEQHRFGVAQRAALQQETLELEDGRKSTIPHLLTMTATPIPRTMAIAYFGSLDLSILDEMPKNRKPIITKIVTKENQEKVYDFIQEEIHSGRQAFVIFPLIDESTALSEVKAATTEYERLSKKVFPDFKLSLLHGKMKPKEKETVMQDFKEKKTDILVSTSVVEVGVDVPNSTVMIIENAERFGLSQLHQFRGRVGRGEYQSYCFLFSDSDTEKAANRLGALEKTTDGFEISKFDLELRGPGQFFGTLQSGIPDIAMENMANIKLVKIARAEAREILTNDPELKKHPLLKDALWKFQEQVHLE